MGGDCRVGLPCQRRRSWRHWLVPCWLLLISCQSTGPHVKGDSAFEQQLYAEAEKAYQETLESASLSNEVESRVLFRLAVIYALPENPQRDREHSSQLLERLMTSHPQTAYALQGELLRDLLRQSEELEGQRDRDQARLGELRSELATSQREVTDLRLDVAARDDEIEELQGTLTQLAGEIRSLEKRLQSTERELEQLDHLKAIDLGAPPPQRNRR